MKTILGSILYYFFLIILVLLLAFILLIFILYIRYCVDLNSKLVRPTIRFCYTVSFVLIKTWGFITIIFRTLSVSPFYLVLFLCFYVFGFYMTMSAEVVIGLGLIIFIYGLVYFFFSIFHSFFFSDNKVHLNLYSLFFSNIYYLLFSLSLFFYFFIIWLLKWRLYVFMFFREVAALRYYLFSFNVSNIGVYVSVVLFSLFKVTYYLFFSYYRRFLYLMVCVIFYIRKFFLDVLVKAQFSKLRRSRKSYAKQLVMSNDIIVFHYRYIKKPSVLKISTSDHLSTSSILHKGSIVSGVSTIVRLDNIVVIRFKGCTGYRFVLLV